MKRLKLFVLLSVAAIAAGCGSSADSNTGSNASPGANQASPGSNVSGPPSNTAIPSSNATAPNGAPNPAANVTPVGGFKMRPEARSAGDNSEVTTALGENLVQTRVFKDNPQISKIEQTTSFVDGKQKRTIKIYLKNGQVKQIDEAKIADAMTEPVANILAAAK